MEDYQQKLPCMKDESFISTNFMPGINQINSNNFQRRCNSNIGVNMQCCDSNSRSIPMCWRPQELTQTSSSKRGNRPQLVQKRFKPSHSNKQVELSFKNRKYFEFCSSSWATHRSGRCLTSQNNTNLKFPQRRDSEYDSEQSTSFYNKSHPTDNIGTLFTYDDGVNLDRQSQNQADDDLQYPIPSMNFEPQDYETSASQTPFDNFKNYSILETTKDSMFFNSLDNNDNNNSNNNIGTKINDNITNNNSNLIYSNKDNLPRQESKILKGFRSIPADISFNCEVPSVATSDSFLSLSESKQLFESSDILNFCNYSLPDFGVGTSMECRNYDEMSFHPSLSSDIIPKLKTSFQQVAASFSDSTAHLHSVDVYDSSLVNNLPTEFNFTTRNHLKSKWKHNSSGKIQSLRGNPSAMSLNHRSNLFPYFRESKLMLERYRRKNSDDNHKSNSYKRSVKNDKSHSCKKSKPADHKTYQSRSQLCQVSESQEKLFGEDWFRHPDISGSFEVNIPNSNLTDYLTTSRTDSWLPQLDVEMEEVVETVEQSSKEFIPITTQLELQSSTACSSQENNPEMFSSFIDNFLENWYDESPFNEEIQHGGENERPKIIQS